MLAKFRIGASTRGCCSLPFVKQLYAFLRSSRSIHPEHACAGQGLKTGYKPQFLDGDGLYIDQILQSGTKRHGISQIMMATDEFLEQISLVSILNQLYFKGVNSSTLPCSVL